MNDWVIPKLTWDDSYRPDRGRVLTKAELEAIPKYYRYSPEDENAVAARTLPGIHSKGAYFIRGSGHNKLGGYTEIPDEYQEVMDRLLRKHRAARTHVPAPIVETRVGATFGVLTIGGCDLAVREALEELDERGHKGDFLRVRAFPFSPEVEAFLAKHETVFVVEQNRDMQLKQLLILETPVEKSKLKSIIAYGGFPLQANQVIDGVTQHLRGSAS
jgi:2-oxoglutarate ferredoxin oxidoreductase subunit alpha